MEEEKQAEDVSAASPNDVILTDTATYSVFYADLKQTLSAVFFQNLLTTII